MTSSKAADYYNALAETTSIEAMADNEDNQWVLRSLKNNDKDFSRLRLCSLDGSDYRELDDADGDYFPGSCEELGWLGHFAKKSAHLKEFLMYESNIFKKCSEESVDRFFEDLGKCSHIKKMDFSYVYLAEIICKLGPVIEKNNITHWDIQRCFFGPLEVNRLFSSLRYMTSLEVLCVSHHDYFDDDSDHEWTDLDDDAMAGCFPSLAALAGMQKLMLVDLNMGMKSSAALGAALPQMANLLELELWENSIDDNMVEVLVPGLAECKRLNLLDLVRNRIGDDGLDVLIQGLPTSIDTLVLKSNQITLAQHLALLRLKELDLSGNTLSSDGPRVIAASLTNPECRLEALHLDRCSIGDEGAAVLAESMRYNQRLTKLALQGNAITETGWDVFSSVLCDTTSINATHGSNHALQSLGYDYRSNVPRDVETLLDLNDGQDKNLVAATKILQTHRHLDMRPLFCGKLLLLPHVVAWLERFAESWLDLKLSSIYEFARAMPMEVVGGVVGEKRGKKRMHSSA